MTGPRERRSPLWRLLTAFALSLVAALFALLVVRIVASGRGRELVSNVQSGRKPAAPEFELEVIWPHTETWPERLHAVVRRGTVSLEQLRGYPTVINFWASWCIPCASEAPRFVASARAHRGEVVFLGLDVKDFRSDARRFLRRHRINYVSVHARGNSVYDAYGLTGLPETYYLDAQGRIVQHSLGEVSRRELEAGIDRIVGSGR